MEPFSALVDEDLSRRIVDELRSRGHRADHLVDRDLANKRTPDQTVFGVAAEYSVLITKDRHQETPVRREEYRRLIRDIRIVRLHSSRDRRFTAETQVAYLCDHLDRIIQQCASPRGARLMEIKRDGAALELINRAEIRRRLRELPGN